MKLADLFDRIYIINLPSRPDRRKEMAGQLSRIGLSFAHPKVMLFPAIRPESKGPFPTLGARGCFMSHLGVLRHASENRYERILVCEDDLDFVFDFNDRISAVTEILAKEDWNMFYGGHRFGKGEFRTIHCGASQLTSVPSAEPVVTAHFIGFQGKTIGELAGYLEAMLGRPPGSDEGGPMHVDGAYSWYRKHHSGEITLA
ncbi:MAG TPA: glycosyltransferase family 25 protein, partial [Burkholderiales bacterium]|nr:glycosyltransferase family 25 protein [Burkholderiales bacterium]